MPSSPIPAPPPTDAAAGVPSLRTLGSGAQQAASGNDSRLTPATASTPGTVSAVAQTFGGAKTFGGAATPATFNSTDTTGTAPTVVVNNPGTTDGYSRLSMQIAGTEVGSISADTVAHDGLINGLTFTAANSRGIGFAIDGTTVAAVDAAAWEFYTPATFSRDPEVYDTLVVGAGSPVHSITIEGSPIDVQILPLQVGGFGEDVATFEDLYLVPGVRHVGVGTKESLNLSMLEDLAIDLEIDDGDTSITLRADAVSIPGPTVISSLEVGSTLVAGLSVSTQTVEATNSISSVNGITVGPTAAPPVASLAADGRLNQVGVVGVAGDATANNPSGRNSLPSGFSSVTITNNLVTNSSVVLFTPHARDATCKELVLELANGSFTVSGTDNATADIPFSWEVKGLL